MKLRNRLFLASGLLLQALYFPINRLMKGGVAPMTSLDAHIPLWPVWVAPYMLALGWWVLAVTWSIFKMRDDAMFLSFIIAEFSAMAIGVAFFVLFPTYVVRSEVPGQDIFSMWLRQVYQNDQVYNAFPSGHVYITTVITLFFNRWKPNRRWLWNTILGVVMLSTLFTHQHYILDLVGGVLLAYAATSFGQWIGQQAYLDYVARRPLTTARRQRSSPAKN
jgi:membrane-associated phospholipid phosphatase